MKAIALVLVLFAACRKAPPPTPIATDAAPPAPPPKKSTPAELCAKLTAFPDSPKDKNAAGCETELAAHGARNPKLHACLVGCGEEATDFAGFRVCTSKCVRDHKPEHLGPEDVVNVEPAFVCTQWENLQKAAGVATTDAGTATCKKELTDMKAKDPQRFACSFECTATHLTAGWAEVDSCRRACKPS